MEVSICSFRLVECSRRFSKFVLSKTSSLHECIFSDGSMTGEYLKRSVRSDEVKVCFFVFLICSIWNTAGTMSKSHLNMGLVSTVLGLCEDALV